MHPVSWELFNLNWRTHVDLVVPSMFYGSIPCISGGGTNRIVEPWFVGGFWPSFTS